MGIGMLSGFWIAHLLGPEDFGIWNAVSLVLVYGAYFEFGVLSTMGRDIPFYFGQGDMDQAAILEGTARIVAIFGAFLAAFFVIVVSFFSGPFTKMALGLQCMAVVLILQQIYTYHRTVLRSHNFFKELSQQQVLAAIASAAFAIFFVISWGLEGRLIAAIFAQTVIILYAVRRNPWPAAKFQFSAIWPMIRVGMSIAIGGFIISLLTTIDRFMVITFLGEEQLGYLGLALLLTNVISLIPSMATQVLYPRITYRFGSSGKDIQALREFVVTPPLILSAFLPIVIGIVYFLLPLLITLLLPAYKPGISAAQIVVVGIFFLGIVGVTDSFLVTIGKLKQYALFASLALAFNITLDYVVIRLGYGIEGIAFAGTLITYFFYSTITIGYALSHYTMQRAEWLSFFLQLWSPFLYMIGLLWLTELITVSMMPFTGPPELLISTAVKMLLYSFGCLPLIFIIIRKNKLDFSSLKLA